MRLPEDFLRSVCFLGSRDRDETIRYRATGFFVGFGIAGRKDWFHSYLVTAKHVIRRAEMSASPLYVRYNTVGGGSTVEEMRGNWIFHEDEAVDLAVLPIDPPQSHEVGLIPLETFATENDLKEHYFGIGDEVYAIGLFYFRYGKERNLPVLRTGIIASMPDEPLEDEFSGKPYDAYLVELRSFGGLSGTPVFTVFHRGMLVNRPTRVFSPLVHHLALVGIIRGHWDLNQEQKDMFSGEIEQANAGLAIVTPAQKLVEILMHDDLVRQRRADEAKLPPVSDDSESV